MTAPFIQNYAIPQTTTLRTTVYNLLDAIDINHITKVEILLCEIMKTDVPEVSLQLFHNYAKKKGHKEICVYFEMILLSTHNS